MLTILSGRDARRGKGFLENAENVQGNEGGHRNGEKEIFNERRFFNVSVTDYSSRSSS